MAITRESLEADLDATFEKMRQIRDNGYAFERDGRKITFDALPSLEKHADWLSNRIAAMTTPTPGGQINYARRRRPL